MKQCPIISQDGSACVRLRQGNAGGVFSKTISDQPLYPTWPMGPQTQTGLFGSAPNRQHQSPNFQTSEVVAVWTVLRDMMPSPFVPKSENVATFCAP